MKKVKKIIGVILMLFNGIGFVTFIGCAGSVIRDSGFGYLIAMLVVFGALFCWGVRLYTTGKLRKDAAPIVKTPQENAQDAERPANANQAAAPAQSPAQRAAPDSAENVGIASAYTVIASYLELPFHDGDNFFLFKKEEDARQFIQVSGRNDLSVRCLDNNIIKRELAEYLCCGYTGAIIKKNLSAITICKDDQRLSAEDLIRDFNLDLSSVGSVSPTAGKKMHNYLNQMSYTYRKYGRDMSAVPDSWKDHLKKFKGEVIRHLLCADLCLPTSQEQGSPLTFSVMTVSMPSGQKWAAIFTDMFAIFRYMRKPPNSIVFPNLLSDIAKDIRQGKITGVAGILINPGREEFKMTVGEIAEQEEWLEGHADLRHTYIEKVHLPSGVAQNKAPGNKPPMKSEVQGNPQTASPENNPPHPAAEPYQKINLSEDIEKASVTPGRAFFTGLLPGEKPYSEKDSVNADENRPNTEAFTKLDSIGFASRWSEYYYDPKNRRIVIDCYTADAKTGERRYHGRKTILPLDLIDQYNQHPEDRNPDKVARIERIQKIMENERFGE